MKHIPVSGLRSMIRYDSGTGLLIWQERTPDHIPDLRARAVWNARYAGRNAFSTTGSHGYKEGSINNRKFLAHRVAWAIFYGSWPKGNIDHADGDRLNNRISNLRVATCSENSRNRSIQSNNRSGLKGIFWNNRRNKWQAAISADGTKTHLGTFETKDAAHAAYCAAAKELHGQFWRVE